MIDSEHGKADHTPYIPNNFDKIRTTGTIATNPRKIEMISAFLGFSTELKNEAVIMLIPAKKNPIKYICNPCFANIANVRFFSLLKREISQSDDIKVIKYRDTEITNDNTME